MRTGKVVRIFSKRQLVLNLGEADGVESGMRFGVYTPATEILDVESGDNLGRYRQRKATVSVTEVFERFSIAVPPARREQEPVQNPLGGFFGRTRMVPGELSVDPHSVEPMPSGSNVQVGDTVEVFPQDDPDRIEVEAADRAEDDSA